MEKFDLDGEILSSVDELERFINNNVIWRDMKMFVSEWLEGIKNTLIDTEKVKDISALSDFQGRAYMCQMFLSLPEKIRDALKDEEYIKSLEERENNGKDSQQEN